MKSGKGNSGISGIFIILILLVSIGLGLRYHNKIANFFDKKQSSNTIVQPTNTSDSHGYSSLIRWNPVTNLADCQIIVRRNLFVPLGGGIAEPSLVKPVSQVVVTKQEPPKPPPDPIYEMILTGIVYNGNELLALVEDSSRNRSFYLKKGDKLKDYYVEKITDKEIVLMNGDSKITQALGSKTYYNTSGKLLASRPANTVSAPIAMSETGNKPVPSPSVAKSESNSSASANSGNANLSLIEQMKARRKKELGQE